LRQPLVRILSTKKRRSVANPQPTRSQPAATCNYWSAFWGQKNRNPWPTHSQPATIGPDFRDKKAGIHGQPATIGPHFGHKKAGIYGQPATIGLHFRDKKAGIHGQPAANPQLLVHFGTKKRNPWPTRSQPTATCTLVRILGTKAEIRGQPAANPQPTHTIGPHFGHKKMGIHGQPAANLKLLVCILGTKKRKSVANPQPTRNQPTTIGPHFGHKKMGINGQPEANLKLLVCIVGTKKRKSVANPQPTRKPAANPQIQPTTIGPCFGHKKMGIHGQLTANLKLLVRILGTKKQRSVANPQPTRKPANPQTRSQSTTIGPHFGHKKMGIHGKPAANLKLLVCILGTKKRKSVANLKILELRKWCGAVGNMTHHPSANESNFYHKKCGPTVLQMVWQWRIGCISTLLSRKNADLELRKWCGAVRNMTHHPPTNEYDFYCKKMRT
jgi:hypothetical protein